MSNTTNQKQLKKLLEKNAGKLRDRAEKETVSAREKIKSINDSYNSMTVTARRSGMRSSALRDQQARLETAAVMTALANAMDAGNIRVLGHISTKPDVEAVAKLVRKAHSDHCQVVAPEDSYNYSKNHDPVPDCALYASVSKNFYWRDVRHLFECMEQVNLPVPKSLKKLHRWYVDNERSFDASYSPNDSEIDGAKKAITQLRKAKKDLPDRQKSMFWLPDPLIDDIKEWDRLSRLHLLTKPDLENAVREFLTLIPEEINDVEDPIETRLRELAMQNISGYFPTPKPVIQRLISHAKKRFPSLEGLRALEPSAGGGHIADALRDEGAHVDVVEYNLSLAAVLKDKNHNLIGNDTFQVTGEYDVVVMNPPFEKGADMEHVQHAYRHQLREGGRLVAVMCSGSFHRSDKKATNWREWFEKHDGVKLSIPPGSFKLSDRTTGVNTVIVVLDK